MDYTARKVPAVPQSFANRAAYTLRNIMAIIEARSDEIIQKWQAFFGETTYFC